MWRAISFSSVRRYAELAWCALRRADVHEADLHLARLGRAARPPARGKVRLLRALFRVLPEALMARAVRLLPRRRFYGV